MYNSAAGWSEAVVKTAEIDRIFQMNSKSKVK